MAEAEQAAHETEPWATDSHNLGGWASNQAVLDHLVFLTQGERLTSVVHNPDERGVGRLATLEVLLVQSASSLWMGGDEKDYNVCVRFEVRRASSGPREITPETIDCPPGVPAAPTPR
ncbi:hypothetical protein ACQEVC_30115 [Plantactinospora sp. CA-294935]|uniref:hypothetical protein n=1 Tax=Plantactinospora sp. CA-294935 TaxID=3240012 RepID=UPI003D8FDEF9